jgi:hypothetical protein
MLREAGTREREAATTSKTLEFPGLLSVSSCGKFLSNEMNQPDCLYWVKAADSRATDTTKKTRNPRRHSRDCIGSYDHVAELLGRHNDEPVEGGDLGRGYLLARYLPDRCHLDG